MVWLADVQVRGDRVCADVLCVYPGVSIRFQASYLYQLTPVLQYRSVNASQGPAAAAAVLAELAPLVFATADYLASVPFFNEVCAVYQVTSPCVPLFPWLARYVVQYRIFVPSLICSRLASTNSGLRCWGGEEFGDFTVISRTTFETVRLVEQTNNGMGL